MVSAMAVKVKPLPPFGRQNQLLRSPISVPVQGPTHVGAVGVIVMGGEEMLLVESVTEVAVRVTVPPEGATAGDV